MNIYTVDRESDTPLYIQIRDSITEAIESGELQPGDKLPPVAGLAKDIGVTQATIRRALQDLGEAGHAESCVGRGTFITDANAPVKESTQVIIDDTDDGDTTTTVNQSKVTNPLEYAARRLRSGVSKALYDIMPLAHKEGIIQLTKGIPDPSTIPDNFIEEVTADAFKDGSKKYIPCFSARGMLELREEIARRFNATNNTRITTEQVLITNGSLQSVTLVAEAALDTKPGIICETPCFQGIPDTFSAMGHWVETVQRDKEGPIIERLNRLSTNEAKLLYLCPYVHNPTGYDLSSTRYSQVIEWARKTGSIVIADEIFQDMRYDGETPPSILKELGSDQTIVTSSVSKSLMSGLRLGWIISSERRIQQLVQLKRLMDHSCPSIIQGMGLSIFKTGKYDDHIKRMQGIYKDRMGVMIKSLSKLMPDGVTWTEPVGGFSLTLELPRGYSSVALLLSAIDRGVSFLPCPLFDIDQRYVNAMRLTCAWVEKNQIKEGVELLASAIEELISQPPGDSGLSGLGNFQ